TTCLKPRRPAPNPRRPALIPRRPAPIPRRSPRTREDLPDPRPRNTRIQQTKTRPILRHQKTFTSPILVLNRSCKHQIFLFSKIWCTVGKLLEKSSPNLFL